MSIEWDVTRKISMNRFFKNELCLSNRKEKKCYGNRNIWYKDQCNTFSFPNDKVCKSDEIFLLEKPQDLKESKTVTMKFVCKKPKCPDIYMSWWEPENKCINEFEERTPRCGDNAYILDNIFGDGECECYVTYGHHYEGSHCFEFYQRGPCDEGKVFIFDPVTTLGTCAPDKCRDKNIKSQEAHKRNDYVPLNGDGQCVKLGTAEGCTRSKRPNFETKVEIDHEFNIPLCKDRSLIYH